MKTNKQIRAHPDAFPTEKEHKVIGTQYQYEHRKNKQVQVGKKLMVSFVMAHVSHRKQVY